MYYVHNYTKIISTHETVTIILHFTKKLHMIYQIIKKHKNLFSAANLGFEHSVHFIEGRSLANTFHISLSI